ncbi:MAG: DUF2306 domain-containing protein [Candidatus Eremiobacteraeota bacterium]|nr:DUF2306 domain-containing protein [Candidatus Eremiobacteraeota bacterium]
MRVPFPLAKGHMVNASIRSGPLVSAESALDAAARTWFVVTALGQLLFAVYILAHYGGSAALGHAGRINATLIHGIGKGDMVSDVAIVVHIVLAFVITAGGPLQLVLAAAIVPGGPFRLAPRTRARVMWLHRVNGRVYVVTAIVISIGALYLTWTQKPYLFHAGPAASAAAVIASTLNGIGIIVCAVLTMRYAVAGKIDAHRRWALRTFLLVSGVWFMRITYGFWTIVTGHVPFGGGAPGTTGSLDGPFDMLVDYSRLIVPLLVLELYFRAQRDVDPQAKWTTARVLAGATLVVAIGIVGTAKLMWLPQMLRP